MPRRRATCDPTGPSFLRSRQTLPRHPATSPPSRRHPSWTRPSCRSPDGARGNLRPLERDLSCDGGDGQRRLGARPETVRCRCSRCGAVDHVLGSSALILLDRRERWASQASASAGGRAAASSHVPRCAGSRGGSRFRSLLRATTTGGSVPAESSDWPGERTVTASGQWELMTRVWTFYSRPISS